MKKEEKIKTKRKVLYWFSLKHRDVCVFSIWCITFPPAVAGCCFTLMGESKLYLPVCHRQWMDSETLHHTCTHTSFILRIGVWAFFCDSHPHKKHVHFIIPALCKPPVLCCYYQKQSKPLNFLPSSPAVCQYIPN